jgi:hypothetical protein
LRGEAFFSLNANIFAKADTAMTPGGSIQWAPA